MIQVTRIKPAYCPTCGGAQCACPPSPSSSGYAPQRWSAEKPKAAGWWWVKGLGIEPLVALVFAGDTGGLIIHIPGMGRFCVEPNYLKLWWGWPGPLPEPLDAPDAETGHISVYPTNCCITKSISYLQTATRPVDARSFREPFSLHSPAVAILKCVVLVFVLSRNPHDLRRLSHCP